MFTGVAKAMDNILDAFNTTKGQVYELIQTAESEWQIRRGKIVFHTCETREEANSKFYRIREMLRIEGEIPV
jgi:hypothetical protein